MASSSDLKVDVISDALKGCRIDVLVTGSIGAVEAPRFIRSLRRLGARVTPWLSEGGKQFTTETAVSWAAASPAVTSFSGEASHIGLGDSCIIAPASASVISKIAQGITDSPVTALAASYLGQKKPVMFVPNMHQSLFDSPFIKRNIETLSQVATALTPRLEEGKLKFPEPAVLADEVSHTLNKGQNLRPTVVAMGTTRGYIDDVRYISNYSSGSLGSKISEELYRQGHETIVIKGPCPIQPKVYSSLISVETNQDLERESLKYTKDSVAVVFASSVLDFIPDSKKVGKIKSSEELKVDFKRTDKIIAKLQTESGKKVGFKLEADLNLDQAKEIAQDYMNKYSLSLLVLNSLKEVDAKRHAAYLFSKGKKPSDELEWVYVEGKSQVAASIASHIRN